MNVGQHLFFELISHIFDFAKGKREVHKVSRMTPEQLHAWRIKEFAKIHKEALRRAGFMSDNDLRKRPWARADLVRRYEVLLRNDLGVRMSMHLLEGLDIRGLDLRKVRGLDQQQIDRAQGDESTQLPDYLFMPRAWKG